jgi:long-chain fatty acid transport protein
MNRLVVFWVLAVSGAAHAGGVYLPFRGVRETGRGGALVAGADDAGSLWDNPAGLAALAGGAETVQLLLDAAYVGHDLTYTRIDSGGNHLAPVSSDPQILPLPTLAAEFDLGSRLALGVGVLAPYSALDGFSATGPQRYALVDIHHTVLAVVEAALAWKINDQLSVGVGVQDLVVHLSARTVFSACPSEIPCAPEDPELDALGEITGTSLFNPSAILGARFKATPWLTLGASVQLPISVSMGGSVKVRLPSSGFYNGASVSGDAADLSTTFPAMVRAGVEVAPSPRLRIEAGVDYELWSEQKTIDIQPHDVHVENAAGVGTYDIGPITILRDFDDTLALRLGVEAEPAASLPLVLRAGFVHESGASTPAYLSVFTADTTKNAVTVGVGWTLGRVRLDASYAHVFMADGDVPAGTSCQPQVNPIRTGEGATPGPCMHDGDPSRVYVGDGTYVSSWDVLGLGMAIGF